MKKLLFLLPFFILIFGIEHELFAGDIESALSRDLADCGKLLQRLSTSKDITSTALAQLKLSADAIRADRLLLLERHDNLSKRAATIGSSASSRQEAVSSPLIKTLDDLLMRLDSLGEASTSSDLDGIKQLLDRLVPRKSRPLHGTLPYTHPNYPPREPADSPIVKPAYKGGDRSVTPADTASTAEAPLSKEIAELAQSLQWNPVLIYEWVKNNVATEWYWGSMKGAEETLRQKSGNDTDQASLFIALLRASGFPARYIKGTIEFFPGIDKAKSLIGLDDPAKIASFLQKAGIPYKPVISGGGVSNFRIEHIWVETFIPYANYRGAVIDDQGKIWVGLDTSIKPPGLSWNSPLELPGFPFDAQRNDYLQAVQTVTPLEFVKAKAEEYLAQNNPGKTWQDLLSKGSIIPDVLKIIPSSLQFPQTAITGEYQSLPEELKHKIAFIATANNSELFSITIDAAKLSNKRIALRYEPETVEDQNTIDSLGGLDNTPAYLVRLRPVLTIDGERIIVAQDGLPMGADYTLNIDSITPNGTERISSSQIAGNLAVIGIVSQKAIAPAAISEDDDAEAILHKEAIGYIARWNRSEDDLAALMGQRISRPTVTIATVGGQIDVTYLMDIPHDFQWKGLFLDAGYRRIETVGRNGKEAEFMRLSALQGSILENRIFEDDLQVDSISTAKLLQQAKGNNIPLLTIDRSNADAILPQLPFDAAVKDDIANAVGQGLTVTIPQMEMAYLDWSGIGYIKENRETGESGWMLSGGIAGSSSAVTPEKWVQQNFMAILRTPYNGKNVNRDPLSASRIILISSTNQQFGTVNKKLAQPLAVLVVDAKNRLVKGARVTFKSIAGGGGFDAALSTTSITVTTAMTGIAKAPFYLGKKTGDNPIYSGTDSYTPESIQMGLNLVTASVETANVPVSLADAFSSYALPDTPVKLVKGFGDNATNVANNPAGSLQVTVADKYGNPVSNVMVQFAAVSKELAVTSSPLGDSAPLPADARNVTFYKPDACSVHYPLFGECSSSETLPRISGYRGTFVNTILGDTVNTKYTVDVTAPGYPALDKVSFTLTTEGYRTVGAYLPHALLLRYLEQYTDTGAPVNATRVGTKLSTPLTAEMLIYMDDYTMQSAGSCSDPDYHANIPYPCWQIVPSGKTIVQKVAKGKGTVVFTASGSGAMSPTRDMDNGKFEADYTAGSTPERSQVAATGSATVTVPEAFADPDTGRAIITGYPTESLTADRKQLIPRTIDKLPINNYILFKKKINAATSSHDPIMAQKEALVPYTVYAVDSSLTVTPGAIAITKDGKAKRDTTFSYNILPDNYSAIISDIDIFRKDPLTGIEEKAAQLHGDKNKGAGTSTILAGSVWDVRKQYSARVTLNNGSKIEIDGDKTPIDILLGGLVPDYNHNRQIDDIDSYRAEIGDKYYFWINDDDGSGDTEGTGIPGSGNNGFTTKISGTRDIVDWFPVHLDIKDLMDVFDPAQYTYALKHSAERLRFVYTDLTPQKSGDYLTDVPTAQALVSTATINDVTNLSGLTSRTSLAFNRLDTAWLQKIRTEGKGVILLEGIGQASAPLQLEVYDSNNRKVFATSLNLSIDGVEQMFRHKNLSQAGDGPAPFPTEQDRLSDPANFSDKECTGDPTGKGRNFVFVHGYNVNAQQARGWNAEMFKRMYWSGSRAKFWGVTWYGWDTQIAVDDFHVTRNFHINVQHALKTAAAFSDFINWTVSGSGGDVTVAAHSLGNMLVSSAVAEKGATINNYYLLDSAVPIEAYDGTVGMPTRLTDTIGSSTNQMVVWNGYKSELFASEWYRLFPPYDERSKLTWRGRFASVKDKSNTYNFYSSGEDVLDNHAGVPTVPDIITKGVGRFAWGLQEKLKGMLPTGWMLGSNYGGWGINQDVYNEWIVDAAGHTVQIAMTPETANTQLTTDKIIENPFFKLAGDDLTLLQPYPLGSNYAKNNHDRLLAEAIPALSLAAGRNEVNIFKLENNFDMNLSYKKEWPYDRVFVKKSVEWWHSDIRDVSYPYVKDLFLKLIELGN